MTTNAAQESLSNLTQREREVLALLCEELEYKEIGARLYITENTVKSHASNLRTKLKVRNNRQLRKQYCPLLVAESVPPSPPDSPAAVASPPRPVPDASPDGLENVTFTSESTPGVPDTQPVVVQQQPNKQGLLWILSGVVIGAIFVCCLITVGVFIFRDQLFGTQATPVTQKPEPQPVTVVVTATPEPAQTSPTIQEATATVEQTQATTTEETATPTQTPSTTPTATPVPPTPTPNPTATPTLPPLPTWTPSVTPLPTPLPVGGRWEENGVVLFLDEVYYKTSEECASLRYNLKNETDHTIVVTIDINDFVVTDNLGRRWRNFGVDNWWCNGMLKSAVTESGSVKPGAYFGSTSLAFQGFVTDTDVDYIDIVVNMSRITNAKWRVYIDN